MVSVKLATSKPVGILKTLSHYNPLPPPQMIRRKHLPGKGRTRLYAQYSDIFFCGDWPASEHWQEKSQGNWDKDGDINSHASTPITPPEWTGKILQILTSHWGEKELDYVSNVPTFMGAEVLACFAVLEHRGARCTLDAWGSPGTEVKT